jgi:outer membrane protein assembly factor BamB
MKKLVASIVAFVLTAGVALGQAPKVFSHPLVPSAEALDRLNLKMSWRIYLPVEDSRDGLATVQILGDRIFAQMRNGAVIAVNADTGQQLWRTRYGPPYKVAQPLGFNYDTVFGVNGSRLYALDRATGRLKWEYDLPNIPTTPPVADSQRVYIPLTGARLVVFGLPTAEEQPPPPPSTLIPQAGKDAINRNKVPLVEPAPAPTISAARRSALGTFYPAESFATTPLTSSTKPPLMTYTPLASATQAQQGLAKGYQLSMIWEYSADSRINYAPVVSMRKTDAPGYLMMPSAEGIVFGSVKIRRGLIYSFQTEAPVSAPMTQVGDIVYMAQANATLVAMNIESGKLLWRLAIGGITRIKPEVTDEDIYLMPERTGMYRIDRATGEVIWRNATAERFLSANKKFVYARDAAGQLLILDRARGTKLSSFNIREFEFPIINDYTDRLFLAAHDGLLICIYDRDYPTPAQNKPLLEEKKPEPRLKEDRMQPKAG